MRALLLTLALGHGSCAPAGAHGTARKSGGSGGPYSLTPLTRMDQQPMPSPARFRLETNKDCIVCSEEEHGWNCCLRVEQDGEQKEELVAPANEPSSEPPPRLEERGPKPEQPRQPSLAEDMPSNPEPYQTADPSLRCPIPVRDEPIMMYSRIIGEHAYLRNWVDWHTRLGVECFFLLGIRMETKERPQNLGEQVVLFEKETFGKMKYLHFRTYWLMAREAAAGYTWVFITDPDEFLVLAPEYGSISDFVSYHRDRLGDTVTTSLVEKNAFPQFRAKHPKLVKGQQNWQAKAASTRCSDLSLGAQCRRVDAFQFSWVQHSNWGTSCPSVPMQELLNKGGFFPNPHVKTMARIERVAWQGNDYNEGGEHVPTMHEVPGRDAIVHAWGRFYMVNHDFLAPTAEQAVRYCAYPENTVNFRCTEPNKTRDSLHSQYFSPNASDWFRDAALVHTSMRSLANLFEKTLFTEIPWKKSVSLDKLKAVVENSSNSTLDSFIEAIGMKLGRECFATWYGVCDTSKSKVGTVSQRSKQELRSGMRHEFLNLQQIWGSEAGAAGNVSVPTKTGGGWFDPAGRILPPKDFALGFQLPVVTAAPLPPFLPPPPPPSAPPPLPPPSPSPFAPPPPAAGTITFCNASQERRRLEVQAVANGLDPFKVWEALFRVSQQAVQRGATIW